MFCNIFSSFLRLTESSSSCRHTCGPPGVYLSTGRCWCVLQSPRPRRGPSERWDGPWWSRSVQERWSCWRRASAACPLVAEGRWPHPQTAGEVLMGHISRWDKPETKASGPETDLWTRDRPVDCRLMACSHLMRIQHQERPVYMQSSIQFFNSVLFK